MALTTHFHVRNHFLRIVVSVLVCNVILITVGRTIVTLGLLAQPCEEGLAVGS